MQGERISALNGGLLTFQKDIAKDSLASRRVETAVVAFNSEVRVVQDFITMDKFRPPTLTASGTTRMGSAIEVALDLAKLLVSLLAAEVNIYFSYPLLTRPNGKAALAMHVEDHECAASVLAGDGFKLLSQAEISR